MDRGGRIDDMNCADAEILIHALLDGELDAGNAREVEAHVAACPACAAKLASFRTMRDAMVRANLTDAAPAHLRGRIEAALAVPPRAEAPHKSDQSKSWRDKWTNAWRTFFGGFAVGSVLSAAVAATLMLAVVGHDQNDMLANEVVSAHLRSLQAGHLTDVETSDQHTVKPWFNGRLDVAPPVIDLTAQGFTLIGGRLDYINGQPVGSIVYRRRKHIINLFVGQGLGAEYREMKPGTVQGFNVRHWTEQGLDFWAVSDIEGSELDEFCQKIAAALGSSAKPS
jgi:anti-sigma factor (TIGR02949 family)